MNYRAALQYLDGLTDYEKKTGYSYATANFDLRRPQALLELLGNPQLRFPSIVVAGTKGKGSTALFGQFRRIDPCGEDEVTAQNAADCRRRTSRHESGDTGSTMES